MQALLQIESTTPPVVTTTKTQDAIDSLKFAHHWILKRIDLFEDDWVTKLFEHGYRFAAHFASLFPGQEDKIEAALIKTAPEGNNPHNWFWMWWKLKWMQDDWTYINEKVYCQPISYDHYKSYMLHCEILEQDLLNLINSKNIL